MDSSEVKHDINQTEVKRDIVTVQQMKGTGELKDGMRV